MVDRKKLGRISKRRGHQKERDILYEYINEFLKTKFPELDPDYFDKRTSKRNATKMGLITLRSAGSHSPIDCVIINKIDKTIHLVQSKGNTESKSKINKIKEELDWLNDNFTVHLEVR